MRKIIAQTFFGPDDYQASLGRAGIDFALCCAGVFRAHLACVELGQLCLVSGQEETHRAAFLKLAPGRVFVSFPVSNDASMIWAGLPVEPGSIVLHRAGDQMYQRTTGRCHWGAISLTPNSLATYSRVLIERDLVAPAISQIIRPSRSAGRHLRGLHKCASRLDDAGSSGSMAHPEVAKALNHDMIRAVIVCLTTGQVQSDTHAQRRHLATMFQFEKLLQANRTSPLRMQWVCKALGVSPRNLELCCNEFLGMGPNRYIRLRRMHAAHSDLRRARSGISSVAEIARRHGFFELGRFAVNYRSIFGESPSDTLHNRASRCGR